MIEKWEPSKSIYSFKNQLQKLKKNPILILTIAISFVIVLILVLGTLFAWQWVGIVEYSYTDNGAIEAVSGKKTFWNIMELLIVPIVLALGGYWLSQNEARREVAANQREKYIAYLDQMSELIDQGVAETQKDSTKRIVARARTMTILNTIATEDKRDIIAFLYFGRLLAAKYGEMEGIVNLSGADLRGVDFSNLFADSNLGAHSIVLSGTNLQGANLCNNWFYGARLNNANLAGAKLEGPRMAIAEAIFNHSNLHKAFLRGVFMCRAIMIETNLTEADLSGADLRGAYLIRSDFTNAKMVKSDLVSVDARGANFIGADLEGVEMWIGNFSPLQAEGNTAIPPSSGVGIDPNHYLGGKKFDDIVITNFQDANLRGAILHESDFTSSNFTNANLKSTDLRGANLTKALLRSADLRGADLSSIDAGYRLVKQIFNTQLVGANLTNAKLEGADLSGANLTDAHITPEQLESAKSLEGATMPSGKVYFS